MEHSKTAQRKLAAIMFTDIAGYTSLMQSDEDSARQLLTHYRSVISEALARNGGQLLQHMGDGSLTMFQSAVEAVQCAVEMQRILQSNPVVPLRAGIHLGDIVIENDGVYGDGVNVASRIEPLADPGSVVVTQSVYDSIKNHRKFRVKYLGAPKLKNVFEPTKVYAVRARGIVVPERLTKRVSFDVQSIRTALFALGLILSAFVVVGLVSIMGNRNSGELNQLPVLIVNPLRNFTGDEAFDGLGELAAHQISRALQKARLVQIQSKSDKHSQKALVLQGSCYKIQDVIVFQTMLLDGSSGKVQHVFDIQGGSDTDPSAGLAKLIDHIMGYWASTETVTIATPKYSAYQDYLSAQEYVFSEPATAILRYYDALEKDPDFHTARTGLIYAHLLNSDLTRATIELRTLQAIEDHSAHERSMISVLGSLIANDFQQAFDTLVRNLPDITDQVFIRLMAARIALEQLQRPRTALELITPAIEADALHSYRWEPFLLYQDILMMLHRYEQLLAFTEPVILEDEAAPQMLKQYVRALCRLDYNDRLMALAKKCKNNEFPYPCTEASILYLASCEYALMGDSTGMRRYTSAALGMTPASQRIEGILHFLGGHYSTSAAIFRSLSEKASDSLAMLDLTVMAAVAGFLSGDSTAIESCLVQIDTWHGAISEGIVVYQKARLHAALADTDETILFLTRSRASGVPCRNGYFDSDFLLFKVFNDHRFRRITESRD